MVLTPNGKSLVCVMSKGGIRRLELDMRGKVPKVSEVSGEAAACSQPLSTRQAQHAQRRAFHDRTARRGVPKWNLLWAGWPPTQRSSGVHAKRKPALPAPLLPAPLYVYANQALRGCMHAHACTSQCCPWASSSSYWHAQQQGVPARVSVRARMRACVQVRCRSALRARRRCRSAAWPSAPAATCWRWAATTAASSSTSGPQ